MNLIHSRVLVQDSKEGLKCGFGTIDGIAFKPYALGK